MVTAVELGEMTWDSPLNGMTLQQCLTTMIVDSDNECPKAWLMRDNGAGYDKVTQQANALGAKNTTLHYLDVRTTSADLALILTKLYRGEIWNDDDRDMVIGLMKRQQYRSGIPAGIGGNGTVADKVGFRDSYLHDAGIVYSGKGDYAFVIMTSGSSWTAIATPALRCISCCERLPPEMVTAAGRCGGRMNESVFSAVLDADALREPRAIRRERARWHTRGRRLLDGYEIAPFAGLHVADFGVGRGSRVPCDGLLRAMGSMTMTRSHAGSSRRNVSVE